MTRKLFTNKLANSPVMQYKVQYVSKDDGRSGQYKLCATLEEAEVVKSEMEKTWGASVWNVVITKL